MIASELISNVVPVLKPEDTCLQALNWMELFRVSHLPMEQGKMYLGLVDDEMIYAHGDLNDRLDVLQIPVEGTFVYENYHIYDVICLAAGSLLSVVPVLDRKNNFVGSITLTDILRHLDTLLCVDQPGGILVLEVNRIDYSLAEVAQIVEYNEARVLSCYVSGNRDSQQLQITLKINTLNVDPILDTFLRFGYTGQFRQKTIFCIYPDKIHAFIHKSRFHFVSFVFAHKTMIHKNTGQLRTHRFR